MIAHEVNQNIIEDFHEYWAIHFCSILEFLHYHKQLSEKPLELNNYPDWSLNDLRGHIPLGYYFNTAVQGSMKNWSFQYFLLNYLNSNIEFRIVDEITDCVNSIYGRYILEDISNFEFILTGRDSILGDRVGIRECNSYIPHTESSLVSNAISNSDLLLKITDKFGFSRGVFCEVESKYGKVDGLNYWAKKNHSLISFSIENNEIYGKKVWIDRVYVEGCYRVKVYFNSNTNVISDFYTCLNWINNIISTGKSFNLKRENNIFDYFIDLLISNWYQPVITTINIVKSFIKNRNSFLDGQQVNVPKLALYPITRKPSLFLLDNIDWR